MLFKAEGIIHPKVLFKAAIESSGTPGCIKHIKKLGNSHKDWQIKTYKTWVPGMCNPNKLLQIWYMFKEY